MLKFKVFSITRESSVVYPKTSTVWYGVYEDLEGCMRGVCKDPEECMNIITLITHLVLCGS